MRGCSVQCSHRNERIWACFSATVLFLDGRLTVNAAQSIPSFLWYSLNSVCQRFGVADLTKVHLESCDGAGTEEACRWLNGGLTTSPSRLPSISLPFSFCLSGECNEVTGGCFLKVEQSKTNKHNTLDPERSSYYSESQSSAGFPHGLCHFFESLLSWIHFMNGFWTFLLLIWEVALDRAPFLGTYLFPAVADRCVPLRMGGESEPRVSFSTRSVWNSRGPIK